MHVGRLMVVGAQLVSFVRMAERPRSAAYLSLGEYVTTTVSS
jgi:hypothetical protein